MAAIVGESRVVTDPAARAGYAVDGETPQCVVYAPSAEQVAAVLRHAADRRLAVIPVRNLTKIGLGQRPRAYDVALSLKEMNQVWYYEPDDLTVSVEPGMKLGDFQHFLSRHNLWLPVDPPGGEKASIGGILAANASGPLRLRYGTARDFTIGMKIATTEGKIVKTGGRVVKNVAGYDLAKLLIGSCGTLGVIVEASFKLFPRPAQRLTFAVAVPALGQARDLRRRIQQSALEPLRILLLAGEAPRLLGPDSGSAGRERALQLWIEAGGSAAVVDRYARALDDLARRCGLTIERLDEEIAAPAWARLCDAPAALAPALPITATLKATLPIAATEEFVGRSEEEAGREGARVAVLAQVGVGVTRLVVLEAERNRLAGLVARLRGAASALGGALVVEQCPWEAKSEIDVWGPPGDDFEMMRKIKAAWDPSGVLSPGRFVGGL